MFKDMKSSFIFGSSHDTSSVEKVDKVLDGEIDEFLENSLYKINA